MRSMQWQLGILGTISAFAYRHRETKKNLCFCFCFVLQYRNIFKTFVATSKVCFKNKLMYVTHTSKVTHNLVGSKCDLIGSHY